MNGLVARFLDVFRGQAGQWLGAGAAAILIAGGGFWVGRATAPHMPAATMTADNSDTDSESDESNAPASAPTADAAPAAETHRTRGHHDASAGAAIIAAATRASGTRYVHRTNSDLRAAPSYASETLKKEPKGAQVQMVALSDKWAEVQDGALKGWMRASILKDTPPDAPGTKRSRKKQDDDSDDASDDH
jgi:hypothetical protein